MATQTKPHNVADAGATKEKGQRPAPAAAGRVGGQGLDRQGLAPRGTVHWNLIAPELIQSAIRREEGQLADMGPFCAVTAPHTGRSPNDKFVVKEPASEKDVDWGKVNQPCAEEKFELLLADVKAFLNTSGDLFVQ